MPPIIAALLCTIFILAIFIVDFKREPNVSHALWIPLIWLLIIASRPLVQWLVPQADVIGGLEESMLTGSPIDRAVLSVLIVTGTLILWRRAINWGHLFRNNLWIFLFFLYAGMSILWSDYSDVAFRRWVKALGGFLMVLIVMTELDPSEAIKTLIKRIAYVLIPISILLIKYYRHLGVGYGFWDGSEYLVGVTTGKNELGRLCLICGFVFICHFLTMARDKYLSTDKKELLIDIFIVFLIVWLLKLSNSATSLASMIVGVFVFIGMGFPIFRRNPKVVPVFFAAGIFIIFILQSMFDIREVIVTTLGRDITLTERTFLWKDLLKINTNPLFGVGFSSFWLGDQLKTLWESHWRGIGEAHNGYLEIYLDLGFIGLFLLGGIIVSSYRKIIKSMASDFDFGRFEFAFLIIVLIYNITESAFRTFSLMWYIFLLISTNYSNIIRTQPAIVNNNGSNNEPL